MRLRIRFLIAFLLIICMIFVPLGVFAEEVQRLTSASTPIIASNSSLVGQTGGPQNLFDGAVTDIESDGWFEEGSGLWIAFDIGKASRLSSVTLRHFGGFAPFNTASYSFYILDESKVSAERVLSLSAAEKNALLARAEYWKCLVSVSGNTESVTAHGISGNTGRIFKLLIHAPDSYDTEDHAVRIFELGLTGTPIPVSADKTALQAAVGDAKMREEAHYTPVSWTPFAAARSAAIAVMNDPDAAQSEINEAESALIRAEVQLVVRADTSELRAMVAELKALREEAYTPESFGELGIVLAEADALLADANALQDEIGAMMRTLQQKKDALVKREEPEEDRWESREESEEEPIKGESSEQVSHEKEENGDSKADTESAPDEPQTGAESEEQSDSGSSAIQEDDLQGGTETPGVAPFTLSTLLLLAGAVCGVISFIRRKRK